MTPGRASQRPPAGREDFQALFDRLKAILKPFEPSLVVTADEPLHYALNTPYSELQELTKPSFDRFRKEGLV